VTLDNAENRFVPDCSGVVTVRAFVTVSLLIERFEMSVYYYYYYQLVDAQLNSEPWNSTSMNKTQNASTPQPFLYASRRHTKI